MRRAVLDRVEKGRRRYAQARIIRDDAIVMAHRDGWPLRSIAERAGVSHTEVRRIIARHARSLP